MSSVYEKDVSAFLIDGFELSNITYCKINYVFFARQHIGHPVPFALSFTLACHSCPHLPSHHTFLLDFEEIDEAVKEPFFTGCHSAANSGLIVSKSLNPGRIALFEQYGQPLPLVLLEIRASHS